MRLPWSRRRTISRPLQLPREPMQCCNVIGRFDIVTKIACGRCRLPSQFRIREPDQNRVQQLIWWFNSLTVVKLGDTTLLPATTTRLRGVCRWMSPPPLANTARSRCRMLLLRSAYVLSRPCKTGTSFNQLSAFFFASKIRAIVSI